MKKLKLLIQFTKNTQNEKNKLSNLTTFVV